MSHISTRVHDSMAATSKQWVIGEDGCLSIGEPATSVTYHSSLNSIILTTKESCVKILDATSGIVLQKSDLSARKDEPLKVIYLGEKDKTVFCDGFALGVRRDLRGALLLDTALQIPVHKSESPVKVEIPLADATQLFKALVNAELPGVDYVEEVLKELERSIELAQDNSKNNHKITKWATVCLNLPHLALKTVCSSLVNDMKRANQHGPSMAIASAISDRLGYLLPASLPQVSGGTVDRALMYSEAARRDTFTMWPHMNYKWALPDPMAQAGFYHQPNVSGDDRAMCFTCNVCLVCWEPTDEPWSEHERHSTTCPFVKGEYTQNVPLSVTYATQPAQLHSPAQEKIHCVSSTSNEDFIATSTLDGNIVVWSIGHLMKKYCQFILDPSDTLVALKTGVQFDKSRDSCSEELISAKEEPGGSDSSSRGCSDVEMKSVSSECCGSTTEEKIIDVPVHQEVLPKGSASEDRPRVRARPSNDIHVTTLCVVDKPAEGKSSSTSSDGGKSGAAKDSTPRSCLSPALLCGVSLRRPACCLPELNEADAAQGGERNETEQLMNVVNEVVSSESSPHIIPDLGESGSDFLAPETAMIPHLLVVAIQHPAPAVPGKKKEMKGMEMPAKHNPGLENGIMTPMDHSPICPEWATFVDNNSDPFEDDDLQIVGFTPAPPASLPSFSNIIPENMLGTSPKALPDAGGSPPMGIPLQGPVEAKDGPRLSSSSPKTGSVVQCVEFPAELAQDFLEVQSLNVSVDKLFVIVVLAPRASPSTCDSEVEEEGGKGEGPCQGGAILVYRLRRDSGAALLEESPCGVYHVASREQAVRSLLVLPQEVAEQVEEEDSGKPPHHPSQSPQASTSQTSSPSGQVAVTLASGKVAILDLGTMTVIAEIEPVENDRIVSLSYCTGIERLCACTSGGKLHFYQISEQSADVLDGPLYASSQRADLPDDLHASKRPKMDDGTEPASMKMGPGAEFLARKQLTPESLAALHSLTKFENLMPRFTATVPPCWSEIQQEQQQRRHPQHLQQQGEATQHTRTWKLTPDGTTWDEHLFEVVLPKPCCVGHVDLKFNLVAGCSQPPNIEVTLLKQNIGNIHKQSQNSPGKAAGIHVDQTVDFNVEGAGVASTSSSGVSREVNNVLDPTFLETHNAEILCGPIRLASCLDLSNTAGLVSLTSPQLLNAKPRSLLLHIKGFPNRPDPESEAKESKKKSGGGASAGGNGASSSSSDKQKKTIKSLFQDVPTVSLAASATERLAATAPKPRPPDLKGCDWLQEVSITVRKMKRTSLPRERQQRNAMIEFQTFHEGLLRVASNPHTPEFSGVSAEHAQNLALEMLSWVAAIQMNDPMRRVGGRCIIWSVQHFLPDLVKASFIDGTRTTAHKCARLLALCKEYAKLTADADAAATFSYDLLQALLNCLPQLPNVFSAGSLRWFFTLLNRVKCMDLATVAHRCTDMLTHIAQQYNERSSSSHALLKARYGLYGHPFEPDLFDVEPPSILKPMPNQSTYASAVKTSSAVSSAAGGQMGEEPDLFEALGSGSASGDRSKLQLECARNHILGLLEVEPLHFICHATSDGTRVERMDAAGSTGPAPSVPSVPLGMTGTINFGEAAASGMVNLPVPAASTPLPNMPMADSLKKLAQMYAKQLQPSSKLMEQAISEAVSAPGKVKLYGPPELLPPTPKSTPQLMTPSVTPPNEYHYSVVGPPMKVPNLGFENSISKQSLPPQPSTSTQAPSAFTHIPPAPPLASPQQGGQKAAFAFPPTQALLQTPPPQVLVIERMHSGARRFVTLDFGKPILLTDVIIPACGDLASLSIDVWIQGEEVDGQRLVVASDIGTCNLVMNNIMPAPICRYLKITTVGRYGTGTTRSRIPIGAFYGHSYILPWEWREYTEEQADSLAGLGTSSGAGPSSGGAGLGLEVGNQAQLLSQLTVFASLQEDLQCRYSLARTRLQSLLVAADSNQFPTAHIQYFLSKNKKKDEDNNITQAYSDCLGLQLQVNLAQRAIWRLQRALGFRPSNPHAGQSLETSLRTTPTDKLRALLEALLDTLLGLSLPGRPPLPRPPTALYQGLTPQVAEGLFKNLCLLGSKKMQICTGLLLVRICGSQPWWGDFLGNMLQEFFHSEYNQVFPQDRVFLLLCTLGQRSLSGPSSAAIMESLLAMLARVLSPLTSAGGQHGGPGSSQAGGLDISLISWILLFLCRNFDNSSATSFISDDGEKSSKRDKEGAPCLTNRWAFIQGNRSTPAKSKVHSSKLHRRLVQRRLLHQKAKPGDSSKLKKKSGQASKEPDFPFSLHAHQALKEFDQYAAKFQRMKDTLRGREAEAMRRLREEGGTGAKDGEGEGESQLIIPRERCLAVVQGLMALLLGMDFTCHVDLFLVACKVLARICSAARPAVSLAEAMSQEQLERLMVLATGQSHAHSPANWGGPWASHAITCLLQDILDGERLFPTAVGLQGLTYEDMSAITETDESMMSSPGDMVDSNSETAVSEESLGLGSKDAETFDKDSSLMVDMLLEETDMDDDMDKLHDYVAGDPSKPSTIDGFYHVYTSPLDKDSPHSHFPWYFGNAAKYSLPPYNSLSGGAGLHSLPSLNSYMKGQDLLDKKKKVKSLRSRLSDFLNSPKPSGTPGLSTALDARLELGLETRPELRLRVMMSVHLDTVQSAFSSPLPSPPPLSHSHSSAQLHPAEEELYEPSPASTRVESSNQMLSQCFNHLFSRLMTGSIRLDSLLQLWLMLVEDGEEGAQGFDPIRCPSLPLSPHSLAHLMEYVTLSSSLSVRSWVFVFQALALLANQRVVREESPYDSPLVGSILSNPNFTPMLLKFLRTASPTFGGVHHAQVGPSATRAFDDFLRRLQVKSGEDNIQVLKELMLKIVYTLTSESGAFYQGTGALDAQCKFLDFVLDIHFCQVDIGNAMSVVESISTLIHHYIVHQERVSCRSSLENNRINARSCFSGLFAQILRGGGESKGGSGDCSQDTLMCSLLKLVNRIVKVAVPSTLLHPRRPAAFSQQPAFEEEEEGAFDSRLPPSPMVMSDDAKGQQTDEEKTETAAAVAASDVELDWRSSDERPGSEGGSSVADIILGHRFIMQNLLQTLGCCSSHSMAALITNANMASTNMSQSVAKSDSESVGDWVYQILITLSLRCSDPRLMLEALFQHLSGSLQASHTLCRLSEPLLWFCVKVLETSQAIQMFLEMGGIKVLCDNLVRCSHRMVSTAPSLISTIMENFTGSSATMERPLGIDADFSDGLQNFAPLGTITCASPSATPPDVLIQASPPHRRARSATWSYHFYPNESWVDLTIHLPFAILLREVQIQPHNTALATCPAFVSLEISHDGTVVTPLSPPLLTSSLACIKLQLQQLEVATLVKVRLHKARDSSTIGLHQLFVLGYPTFWDPSGRGSPVSSSATSTEDHITRISINWIQLLHHCLTAHPEITNTVAAAASPTPNLVNTCTSILVSSATALHCPKIQEVLLKIGLFSRLMGLELIHNLLRAPTYTNSLGGTSSYLGKVSGMANEWTVDILYQLGTIHDEALGDRVEALVQWLGDSARMNLQRHSTMSGEGFFSIPHPSLPSPAPPHVNCVAAVLWNGQECGTAQTFRHVINRQLVSSLYEWSNILEQDGALKRAVDFVLCACCHINPEYFTLLLEWMGIVVSADRSLTASISDDRKDIFHQAGSSMQSLRGPSSSHSSQAAQLTDDSKEACGRPAAQPSPRMQLVEFGQMVLDEARLTALAVVCKSPVALRLLVDSGFPAVLAQSLLEFCSRQMSPALQPPDLPSDAPGPSTSHSRHAEKSVCISPELVAAILNFFADIGSEGAMKDWLGGPEGNIFWPPLLTMLCNTPAQRPALFSHHPSPHKMLTAENRDAIETATIRFFTSLITCHSENQLLFAKVLCDIIREQGSCKAGALVGGIPLSGFTRRMLLQVLLEDEKILVAFTTGGDSPRPPMNHPRYGAGRKFCTRTVSLNSTCGELVKQIQDSSSFTTLHLKVEDDKKKPDDVKKDMSTYQVVELLSNAAGLQAQERREKSPAPGKGSLPPPRPPTRRGRPTLTDDLSSCSKLTTPSVSLRLHPNILPNQKLPAELTLSQILVLLNQRGALTGDSALQFIFDSERQKNKVFSASSASASASSSSTSVCSERREEREGELPEEVLLSVSSFPSALQVFASAGGLALLAEHLPLLYPEITRQAATSDAPAPDNNNVGDWAQDWVTVESSDEFYDPFTEPVSPAPTSSRAGRHPPGTMPTIPPHSLIAFGLFLRLPGYAEVLLKERKKAQCLLRLVLGVTDDGDGGHILTSPIASSLPTLPFTVLKTLLDASPLTTDDGVLLRRMALDIGVVHLLLACLSVLSHQAPRIPVSGFQQETQLILAAMQAASSQSCLTPSAEKTQHYWAKGTGFGTGSTTSSWDAEQALLRQRSEEEHVTCLLQVLASYISPAGSAGAEGDLESYGGGESGAVPDVVGELLSQSCLVPALSSYLRNDSVLDMARHVPLYRALLQLLRALASVPALVPLMCPLELPPAQPPTSIQVLLDKMKGCVDTYANRLKANKGKNGGSKLEEEENEGLALLIPDIQETARIVHTATERHRDLEDIVDAGAGSQHAGDAAYSQRSMEERYTSAMKDLQFDTFEMVSSEASSLKFLVPHHFESIVKAAGEINNAARTRRLAQEAVTLSTSLPLSASSSVFVRCDDERLDIMKVLITGPSDTPYCNGCFEFDVYFPQDYPNSPPSINLETTGNHSIRFNPNLYNDGKVCLSVLNTWHGRPEEKWNPQTSSFLQVLVSIQSLILVSEPYFNEPGYERSRGTPSGTASSRDYDANIRQATVKWAMLEQIRNPSPSLKEVIHRHFWLKRHEVLKQCEDWIAEMEAYSNDKRTGRSIAHSTLALKRHYNSLREELAKMKPPEDLAGEDEEAIDPAAKHYATEQATAAPSPPDKEVAGPSGLPPMQASMGFLDPLGLSQDLSPLPDV